jgi:hypothetical protein
VSPGYKFWLQQLPCTSEARINVSFRQAACSSLITLAFCGSQSLAPHSSLAPRGQCYGTSSSGGNRLRAQSSMLHNCGGIKRTSAPTMVAELPDDDRHPADTHCRANQAVVHTRSARATSLCQRLGKLSNLAAVHCDAEHIPVLSSALPQ